MLLVAPAMLSVAPAMWWLGGWGKIENKAKFSPSKAGARAELGKI